MSMAGLAARHDPADLRRLRELGCEPLQWRRPPAARSRQITLLCESPPANGLLADLVRGLRMTGLPVKVLQTLPASPAAREIVIIVGQAHPVPAGAAAVQLPAPSEWRGNATVKRAAWCALRKGLR